MELEKPIHIIPDTGKRLELFGKLGSTDPLLDAHLVSE